MFVERAKECPGASRVQEEEAGLPSSFLGPGSRERFVQFPRVPSAT